MKKKWPGANFARRRDKRERDGVGLGCGTTPLKGLRRCDHSEAIQGTARDNIGARAAVGRSTGKKEWPLNCCEMSPKVFKYLRARGGVGLRPPLAPILGREGGRG